MSALSDTDNIKLDDPAKTGDATEDPKWRKATGFGDTKDKK